jgi:hypothetical protein
MARAARLAALRAEASFSPRSLALGQTRRPREFLDAGADLDDVLAEELHDERGGPRLVAVQQRAERPLADESVVVLE